MFATIRKRLRRMVRDESGPTAVEYAVMLALIVMVCIASIRVIGTNARSVFQTTGKAFVQKSDGNQDGNGQF